MCEYENKGLGRSRVGGGEMGAWNKGIAGVKGNNGDHSTINYFSSFSKMIC